MNRAAPPGKKEAATRAAHKLIAGGHYATLALLANIFAIPFWFFEQRGWQRAHWLDNERWQS